MKIQKTELATKLNQIKGVVPKKTTMPILQGILVKEGYLIANNLEMTVKAKLEGTEGECFIIPERAFDLINNLPDGEVDISVSNGNTMTIRADKIKNKYQTMDPEPFPVADIDGEGSEFTLKAGQLLESVKRVSYAIPQQGGNATMSTMCLQAKDGQLNFVGLATASTESQELFTNGKTAMQLNWSHQYPAAVKALGADKVGCAPMIAGSAGVGATTGPWYESVMKNSENKEMAKKYVEFMYEHNADYMDLTLKIAGRTSVYDNAGKIEGNEHTTAVLETLEASQTQARPMVTTWSQIEEVLIGVVESSLGGDDVEEALESAKKQIEMIGK